MRMYKKGWRWEGTEWVLRWEKDVWLCVARTPCQKEAGGSGRFISWFINIYVLSLTQNKMCSVHAPPQRWRCEYVRGGVANVDPSGCGAGEQDRVKLRKASKAVRVRRGDEEMIGGRIGKPCR